MSCLFTSRVTKSFTQACSKDYLDQNISSTKGSPFTIRDLRDALVSMDKSPFGTRKIMDIDLIATRLPTIDDVQRFLQQNTKSGEVRAVAIFESPESLTRKAIEFIGNAKQIAVYINNDKATQAILLDALHSVDTNENRSLRNSILMKVVDTIKLTRKRSLSPLASLAKKHKSDPPRRAQSSAASAEDQPKLSAGKKRYTRFKTSANHAWLSSFTTPQKSKRDVLSDFFESGTRQQADLSQVRLKEDRVKALFNNLIRKNNARERYEITQKLKEFKKREGVYTQSFDEEDFNAS